MAHCKAGDMAGTLQHRLRALISRSSNEVMPRGQADELARLRDQLRQQRRSNLEMKQMLKNQVLAIKAARPFNTSERQYDAQLHTRRHALQDECRERVSGEEFKMRAELRQILQRESALCRQLTQSLEADQKVYDALQTSAEREQRLLSEA